MQLTTTVSVPLQLLLLFLQLHLQLHLLLPAAAQNLQRSLTIRDSVAYRDFVPLTASNLTDIALKDEQAWILHVHDGFLEPEIKRVAGQVRGLVRFGLISMEDIAALDMLKFDPGEHFFRSLPFGWETRKKTKFLDTDSFKAALEHASASVPDDLVNVVKSEKDTKAALAEAVASKPTRFTVLFTAKDSQPSLLQRVLSRKLIRNFNFALLPNADAPGAVKAAGLGDLKLPVPGLSVLSVTSSGGVRSSRMSAESSEQLQSFAEVLRFLVEFNRQFRPDLPGDSGSSDRRVLYMSDILDAERLIFDIEDAAVVEAAGAAGKEAASSDEAGEEGGEDLKDVKKEEL